MVTTRDKRQFVGNRLFTGIDQTALLVMIMLTQSSACCAEVVPNRDQLKIVVFGDSTTAPRGTLNVYSNQLRDRLHAQGTLAKVINSGVGGNNTGHALKRLEHDVLNHDPDIVIIQFGINDSAVDVWKSPPVVTPRISLDQYKENLRQMIKAIQTQGGKVILMTPNPMRWTPRLKELYGAPPYQPEKEQGFNVLLVEYAAAAREISKTSEVSLIDVYAKFEEYGRSPDQSVDELLLDGMHPNDVGHQLVTDLIISSSLKKFY